MGRKLIAEDDCLAPKEYHEIVYTGPDPLKVYRPIKGLIRRVFVVESKDIWEREFRWMPDSDPAEFFIRIFAKKTFDMFTTMYIEIVLHGWQPLTPNKIGSLRMKMGGTIKTELPQDTFLQRTPIYRALMWMYFYYFYFKTRREHHLRYCKEKLDIFRNEIMKILGIGQVEEK